MDPPPSSPPKLRLMCSYGGRIIPRPQTKSFYYSGGENRLITIPTADNTPLTLSSFATHLSTFLRLATPFVLKYQLPDHDLDSLISISTDDDLQIMLEEHKRLSSSSTASPSRIRLFLFPVGSGDKAELTHPKRESWFVDALRSARVGFGADKKMADPSSGIEMHKPIHASGFPVNLMHLPPQQTQVIREDTRYVQPNMPGMQPVTSYYPVYYPSNQRRPMYYFPVAPAQPYNVPVQHSMVHATGIGVGQPQAHPNASLVPTQMVFKEVAAVPQPAAELTSQQCQKIPAGHQLINVPHTETETRHAGAQVQHQPQSFGVTAGETANYANKLDDDPARVQIYKSQPPPPMLPSQYQTMTKATTLLLSEALAKLHTDNAEQQITTSEP
ncbi:hypothetical protein GOBAR_AA14424 [Gossypium barbadense]|uniref:PB1 domain-containing protein n=1 Tax=Gossypium barbadense TaxID=3634 RepID=A0A2P5XSE9_GOSBA|nr:hypothetical protein GOBAR_AA14424 [Gossypium barbadense]